MTILKVVTSLVAIGMFGATIAQDEARMKIEVVTDHGDGDAVHMAIDSEDLDFNLHEMQEGENQAIVDEHGRTILVTRKADGFTFDVDGKTIEMPVIGGDHQKFIALQHDHDENVDVHVVHDVVKVDGDHEETHKVKIVKKVEVVSD